MARPAGFEPATPSLEGSCSFQLSYGRVGIDVARKAERGNEPRSASFVNRRTGEGASAAAVADRIRRIRIGDAGAAAATATTAPDRIAGIGVGDAGAIATAAPATAVAARIGRIAIGAASTTPAAAAPAATADAIIGIAIGAALRFRLRSRRRRWRPRRSPRLQEPCPRMSVGKLSELHHSLHFSPRHLGCLNSAKAQRGLCRQ